MLKIIFFWTLLQFCKNLILNHNSTIAIIHTNDIHGSAFSKILVRGDTGQQYEYGGLVYMAQMIQTLKKQYKNLLFLDSGDQYQGAMQSSAFISKGETMNQFFNAVKLSGFALGNHQFDISQPQLFSYLSKQPSFSLAANIRSGKERIFLPKQKISQIYNFGEIKIGVLGLSFLKTPQTSTNFKKNYPHYKFLDYSQIIIEQSKHLKKRGTHFIILLAHVGNSCSTGTKFGFWKSTSKNSKCGSYGQTSKIIDSLPKGTIDGFLQGHSHKFAHHFYKNIPYMGVINGGTYFNVLYLTFDANLKIVQRIIEGPIPVCFKIFSKIKTCNYIPQNQIKQAGELINWKFHGVKVEAHKKLQTKYQKEWYPKMKPYHKNIIYNQIHLYRNFNQQSQLANLITTLIHNSVPQSDFVILNPGNFRTEWLPGMINYQQIYNMLPFSNRIASFDVTGGQLVEILQILQHGIGAFYHSYGLNQKVCLSQGQKSLIDVTLKNGSRLDLAKVYKIVTLDFLIQGGDAFADVLEKDIKIENIQDHGLERDLVAKQLSKLKIIKKDQWKSKLYPTLTVVKGSQCSNY